MKQQTDSEQIECPERLPLDETCDCGAKLYLASKSLGAQAKERGDFRAAHQECRGARLRAWHEAAEALREAGGLLYPGSEPMGGTMGAEYRQACHVLHIPLNGWQKWLDALDAYGRAVSIEDGTRS